MQCIRPKCHKIFLAALPDNLTNDLGTDVDLREGRISHSSGPAVNTIVVCRGPGPITPARSRRRRANPQTLAQEVARSDVHPIAGADGLAAGRRKQDL